MLCSCEYKTAEYIWHNQKGVPCGTTLFKVIQKQQELSTQEVRKLARAERIIQKDEKCCIADCITELKDGPRAIPRRYMSRVWNVTLAAGAVAWCCQLDWIMTIVIAIATFIGAHDIARRMNRAWPRTKEELEAKTQKVVNQVIDSRNKRVDEYKSHAPDYTYSAPFFLRTDWQQYSHLLRLAKEHGKDIYSMSELHYCGYLNYDDVKKYLDEHYWDFFPLILISGSWHNLNYQSKLRHLQGQFDRHLLWGGED